MIQEFLRRVPLFAELDDDELTHVLMAGLVRRYPEGTLIIREGAEASQLHVIHEGRVRIGKVVPGVGEEALTILGPAQYFGEVELLAGGPPPPRRWPTRTARSSPSRIRKWPSSCAGPSWPTSSSGPSPGPWPSGSASRTRGWSASSR